MILELGAGFYGSIERVLLYIVCCCCRFVRYTLRSTGTYSVYVYSIHELLHAIPPNCIQLNEPPPERASTYPRFFSDTSRGSNRTAGGSGGMSVIPVLRHNALNTYSSKEESRIPVVAYSSYSHVSNKSVAETGDDTGCPSTVRSFTVLLQFPGPVLAFILLSINLYRPI